MVLNLCNTILTTVGKIQLVFSTEENILSKGQRFTRKGAFLRTFRVICVPIF